MTNSNFDDNYTALLDYLWELTDNEKRFLEQREFTRGFLEASLLFGIISPSTYEWLLHELDKIPYNNAQAGK